MKKEAYELYEFLTRTIVTGIVRELGESHEKAAQLVADEVCQELIYEFGGAVLYLPKAMLALNSERNEKIYAEFVGSNCSLLARKYRLSDMRIRQIVYAVRAKKKRESGV